MCADEGVGILNSSAEQKKVMLCLCQTSLQLVWSSWRWGHGLKSCTMDWFSRESNLRPLACSLSHGSDTVGCFSMYKCRIIYELVGLSVELFMNLKDQINKIFECKIVNSFLPINFKVICFVCSKEPSHRDGSIEYPQHMFSLRYKKNHFQLHTFTWSSKNCRIIY